MGDPLVRWHVWPLSGYQTLREFIFRVSADVGVSERHCARWIDLYEGIVYSTKPMSANQADAFSAASGDMCRAISAVDARTYTIAEIPAESDDPEGASDSNSPDPIAPLAGSLPAFEDSAADVAPNQAEATTDNSSPRARQKAQHLAFIHIPSQSDLNPPPAEDAVNRSDDSQDDAEDVDS